MNNGSFISLIQYNAKHVATMTTNVPTFSSIFHLLKYVIREIRTICTERLSSIPADTNKLMLAYKIVNAY